MNRQTDASSTLCERQKRAAVKVTLMCSQETSRRRCKNKLMWHQQGNKVPQLSEKETQGPMSLCSTI